MRREKKTMEEKKYKVNGMFCAACQSHVQKAAEKVEGVSKAEVSLLTNSMVVSFKDKADDKAIEKAVKDAGYSASPELDESLKSRQRERSKELRKTLIKLCLATFFLLVLMYFSMGMMWNWPMFSPMVIDIGIELGLATIIIAIYAHYFTSGFKALFKLHPTMLSLIAIGSGVSYLYGLYTFIMLALGNPMSNDVYFEAAGMILTLVSLGKYFEALAKSKTTSSIENLLSLVPEAALLLGVDGQVKEVASSSLKKGDICLVKPGSRVPSDGTIIEGYGHLEEAAITGEAVPVYKKVGDKVIGSTLNTSGSFKMEISEVGEDTTVNKIVHLVEEAANSKAKLAQLADRVSAFFVPTVITIAIIVFVSWLLATHDVALAVNFGVSVLVVSCPCALGLATPVAIMVGTGKGAEHGILIKSASAFEDLSRVKAIVFDKTGTLTSGHLKVTSFSTRRNEKEVADGLISLESYSEHPLAGAIVLYLEAKGYEKEHISDFIYEPGFGVGGRLGDHAFLAGNAEWLKKNSVSFSGEDAQAELQAGSSVTYIGEDKEYVGFIALRDELKEGVKDNIAALAKMGYESYLVSGDNPTSANALANQVGISHVYSSVKPDGKVAILKELQKQGNVVAMVGDGINDAPALEAADVGIAIGSGTDIAIDSADIVLVNSSLHDLLGATILSRKVVHNIKLNLFWAFFYNAIGIPLAAGAFHYAFGWDLSPMIASGMMALSSVTVVLNALRLKRVKL
jgi:Cu+-exporting ATPase